ncbi:hypothetical protein [Dysgonomonas sp. 511]|uniref:hypothetical protein n=1 Tax=Dysgonomonas sp. 511 TaxID=2302930 RepID=UPI0013CFDEC5|nr:hypothetical protein [Dysgonomonas sp. 511]NDV79343.1 hypothetical protein [Dysgonomonas sp. 511]
MSKKFDLHPVENLLDDVVHPHRLAQILDDMAFYYAEAVIELKIAKPAMTLDKNTAEYLHWLHTLRNVFKDCSVK